MTPILVFLARAAIFFSLGFVAGWLMRERSLAPHRRRVGELERRAKLSLGSLPCGSCGGPHLFDTSVPSVAWNTVIRAKGLPEYLCTSCIVREFVAAKTSFTATLWNNDLGLNGTPIEVRVGGQPAEDAAKVQEENNALRWSKSALEDEVARLMCLLRAKRKRQW